MTMSGERDLPRRLGGFEPLPLDLEPLDSRLRRDGLRWQVLVPDTRRLDALARSLAATPDVPGRERPPSSDTPLDALPDVSAVRPIPFRRRSRMQNLLSIVAMVAIVALIGILIIGVAHRGPAASPQAPASFTVTRVDLSVDPTSIAGRSCGTPLTVTYTATFHLAPNGPGGTIRFEYTLNNGRGTTMASVTATPGRTVATYSFAWSGNLPADHTYPESGGVIVQSPNAASSPTLGPSGRCS